ncbi:hypothetical protein H8L32_02470 [Undibacterium sp. CY18W]|uniref:Uncharacterized protein n=1 Tax=Undibacterium hunanense TaxID=2762292 RepID=A0ABR6ZKA1_9BURK|nr:hypothetical protein [Undibacterium hunanense]MBC3916341.1 hypothetical protein [Undibacterium hunanense]
MTNVSKSTATSAIAVSRRSWFDKIFGKHDELNDVWRINTLLLPLLGIAIFAAGCVGWNANAVGPVLLWVFASLAAGGTAGFLFGIPKSGISTTAPASASSHAEAVPEATNTSMRGDATQRARPNTNLEEVSDWLTKILVGLTLVNLKDLQTEVGRISLNAAAAIRPHPTASDVSIATALVVGFALMGFLAAYLYTRLFIQGAIVRSDDQMGQYRNAVARAEQIGQQSSESNFDAEVAVAVIPSAASLSAAQDVADAAPPNRPELVLQPLRQLASQYEMLRQTKDYSRDRTQQMTEIVNRMRPHAIAAAPYIDELIQSTSTGDHLAATVILQMKYMQDRMEWLVRRLVEERAFIGYQAASALLARVRVAGIPECKDIQSATAKAKEERLRMGVTEKTLDQLIDKILAVQ